jgi:hypothetical protein
MSIYLTHNCSNCPPFIDLRMAYISVLWAGFESLLYAEGPTGYGGLITSGGYDNRGGEGRWLTCTVRIDCASGEWSQVVYDMDPWTLVTTPTATNSAGYGGGCTYPGGVTTINIDTTFTDTNHTYQTVNAADHSIVYSTTSRILTVDNSMNIWRARMEAFIATQDLTTYAPNELKYWHYDSTYAGGPVSDTGGTVYGGFCSIGGGFYYGYDFGPRLYCVKLSLTYENLDTCIVNTYTEAGDDFQTPHVDLVQAKDGHCHKRTTPLLIDSIAGQLGVQAWYNTPCLYCSSCAAGFPTICNPAP